MSAAARRSAYPSWQQRHEGILLWLLQHPAASQQACAAATGYSPWQISRILNSPAFQVRYRAALSEAVRAAASALLNANAPSSP